MVEDFLVSPLTLESQLEISAVHHHMCGVVVEQHIHIDDFRGEVATGLAEQQVVDFALYVVVIVEVGLHRHVSAHAQGHRFVGDAQLIEVGLVEIGGEVGVYGPFAHLTVGIYHAIEQAVVSLDIGP